MTHPAPKVIYRTWASILRRLLCKPKLARSKDGFSRRGHGFRLLGWRMWLSLQHPTRTAISRKKNQMRKISHRCSRLVTSGERKHVARPCPFFCVKLIAWWPNLRPLSGTRILVQQSLSTLDHLSVHPLCKNRRCPKRLSS